MNNAGQFVIRPLLAVPSPATLPVVSRRASALALGAWRPLLLALLALLPGLLASLALRRREVPSWPFLLAGFLLPFVLALWPALADRQKRRRLQRRLREALERLPDEGTIHEGTLVFVRPQGDEEAHAISTFLESDQVRLLLSSPPQPVSEEHARLFRGITEDPGEQAQVGVDLDTPRGRVSLEDGRRVVFLGSHEEGEVRGTVWDRSRRTLEEGDRILVRGRLIDEALEGQDGFRKKPFSRLTIEATVDRDSEGQASPLGKVLPMMSAAPPRIRWTRYHATALLLMVLSLGAVVVALRRAEARPAPIQSLCGEDVARALDGGDPWSALVRLRSCENPLLEARAHWMVANFSRSSDAFLRAATAVSSPSEVEAHALAGRWAQAARSVERLPKTWFKGEDEQACLAAAFRAREPGASLAADSPLRRQDAPMCHVLGQDLKLLRGLSDAEYPPAPRPPWSKQNALDATMALLPALDAKRPMEERVASDLPRVEFDATAGREPSVRHRSRPIALHAHLLEELRRSGVTSAKKKLLEAELAPDVALFLAYTGQTGRVRGALGPVWAYASDSQAEHHARIPYDQRDKLPPYLGWVSLLYNERSMVICGAWAAYHAGFDHEALGLARMTSESHSTGVMARWIDFRKGTLPFDLAGWIREEPWNEEFHRLVGAGDARPLVAWLRDNPRVSWAVLERSLGRITQNRDALGDYVASRPVPCWDCGLGALLEHTAERLALARRLGESDLSLLLGAITERAVAARLDRNLAVPLLLVEQYRDH